MSEGSESGEDTALPDRVFTPEIILKEIEEFYNLELLDDHIIDDEEIIPFELPEEYRSLMEEKSYLD
ncbi:hypothetical protein PPL_11190 [Heterostelium album PN500]|uniref:Uncharacterized protein n=1 Tax=Heterostelium pallidum (strain ATCC 26659 / Pp 5 / PN500) TaxID=670386 RepID=D3BTT0_HETP5|nr:hypothetical protein PPL_11190 [Heterostelium album PN500]EFA75116.1 hypothetical protein PPL_11190 [Heterostelium album PN500]|eukprot:XP_020427250.1 hypothetical protein PPL_11190 [Heterostelium album PN500]